ncbi:bifunctional UDP-N-acetylglucosamine diphosphorylase/glucosamine-1-phosphate N-acetyltransferase GlmU [Algiphilus aromaticivorans]|uniref:bifunctional UDP-N-acetylglucosamine diphosphorylase/glucosamine-1-phosphate N-acetyltransferase GlmU n=1 Tax=Algiphilus aromaticivorans TaxID=382454 RepID=UPI0005C22730|nr:bifunctional UDP-N-acetylglucosamine diphosphorylase/glucosamine-1-phosphate N-acetyltransferase GlmU [Algiphilus aromaticivorans]
MSRALHIVVLAAGQGTRMKSALPKVLHPVGGRPMLERVLDTAEALGAVECHVVHGHGGERVRQATAERERLPLRWVEQTEQLGTAHAVMQAMPAIPDDAQVLVMYGDVPLVSAATLGALLEAAGEHGALLGTRLVDPSGYGRLLRDAAGRLAAIVEDKEATPEQRAIDEINTGFVCAPADDLRAWLARVDNANAKGEYYLTDIVAMAAEAGQPLAVVTAGEAAEVEGVNDRVQLSRAERVFQKRAAESLMHAGATLEDPARFDLRGSLEVGSDVVIAPDVIVEGRVRLGDGVRIGPFCRIKDSEIAAGARVEPHCDIEGAVIGEGAVVGPYARLRNGTELGAGSRVGNFVEIKQAQLGPGAKANHLSYLGDATVGAGANIGAGTITCNYDGANKHRTEIGADAFIGSNSALVAPVRVGDRATIAAGSVLTRDAPDDALTVARSREQKSIVGWKRPTKGDAGKQRK